MPTFSLVDKHQALDRHNQHLTERINRETGATPAVTTTHATPAGDEHRLRGIPIIGRGVTGAITGTTPMPSDPIRQNDTNTPLGA